MRFPLSVGTPWPVSILTALGGAFLRSSSTLLTLSGWSIGLSPEVAVTVLLTLSSRPMSLQQSSIVTLPSNQSYAVLSFRKQSPSRTCRTLSQIATLISSPESGKGIVFSVIFSFQDLELCQRARPCRHSVFNLADSSSSDPEHFRKLDLGEEEFLAEAPKFSGSFHGRLKLDFERACDQGAI